MKHADSLTARLRQFFRDNPSEILTFEDIAAKFGCTREAAKEACRYLRTEGSLVTAHVAMANPERPRR